MALENKKQNETQEINDDLIIQAITYHQNGDFANAQLSYEKILKYSPENTIILTNLATLALQIGKIEYGIELIQKSLKIDQNQPSAANNLGVMLQKLNRNAEAIQSFNMAIDLKSDYAEAHANKANSFSELKNFEEAEIAYDIALHYKSDYLKAYLNKAKSLKEAGKFDKALLSFQQAQMINSDVDFLDGELLETQMHLSLWDDFMQQLNDIKSGIILNKKTIHPFPVLGLFDDPSIQRKTAEIFASLHYQKNTIPIKVSPYVKHSKIRIGYFSSDFHNHATMHLMAELFEHHDKDKFQIFAFSFGSNKEDSWTKRVKPYFDDFLDVSLMSDQEIVDLAKDKELDIAIDLKGYTKNSRPQIFAQRCAPTQLSYLGYPGTMGADFIDYIIADQTLITQKDLSHFAEKVIFMPNSYQVNMADRTISEKSFSRQDFGLPDEGFIFCSFNNNYKITPSTFSNWSRILKAVDKSVLWLYGNNQSCIKNLKSQALNSGIDDNRLIFADYLPVEEHLKRIQLADLFLDTSPYNAHTTCSDAIRVGLPVLTITGKSFASRVASSLLKAVGMDNLITTSESEYESLAIELASTPQKLKAIKAKLNVNRLDSTLFKPKLFTKHIEAALSNIYERSLNAEKPNHIYLDNE